MRKIFALLILLVTVSALTVEGCGVDTPEIYLTILAPQNATYDGIIPLEVEAMQSNSFLHGADVTVIIGDDVYTLPEGQNSYRSEVELAPGYYTANVMLHTEEMGCYDDLPFGEIATGYVEFTVAGEVVEGNETIVYPGIRKFTIERSLPTRAKYVPGELAEIRVFLTDLSVERVAGAMVIAVVQTPDGAEQFIPLQETLVSGKPVYKNTYTFSQDGFYEMMVTAEKDGYENASLYMPTIKVGEEAPVLPADIFCQQGICIRVESPSELETYPDGTDVELRIQLIEESTVAPIADATAVVVWNNGTVELDYDWNGYYFNISKNMTEGNYLVTFHVEKGGIVLEKNITLHVSPDQLVIAAITPTPGSNVTESFMTMQTKVTDQEGEIVTNANVRVIVTTPLTGTRTVQMSRNPGSGYYESEYTFADTGQYTIKIIASKIGYVSSESVYTVDVIMAPEGVTLTEQDVVIAALIIGVLLIIATLWKALL